MDGLPGLEHRLPHPGAIDVSAIGGAQVNEAGLAVLDNDLAMGSRDGGITEREIIGRSPPD